MGEVRYATGEVRVGRGGGWDQVKAEGRKGWEKMRESEEVRGKEKVATKHVIQYFLIKCFCWVTWVVQQVKPPTPSFSSGHDFMSHEIGCSGGSLLEDSLPWPLLSSLSL